MHSTLPKKSIEMPFRSVHILPTLAKPGRISFGPNALGNKVAHRRIRRILSSHLKYNRIGDQKEDVEKLRQKKLHNSH